MDAPKRISNRVLPASISGCLSPFYADGQPVLLNMPGTDDLFIAVFSTEEKLRASMAEAKVEFDKIILIMEGYEFIESVQEHYRIMYDPHLLPNGRLRYLEIVSSDQELPEFKGMGS